MIGSKILGKFYVLVFMPHATLSFLYLDYDVYFPILCKTRAPIFLLFGTWPVWKMLLLFLLKPISDRKETPSSKNQTETKKER